MKTFSIKTFGCRLNRAESERFESALLTAGLVSVPFGAAADVVLFHTCAITATAEHECLRLIRQARSEHPSALLIVVGCAVESGGAERLRALGVDWVVVREEKETLPKRILSFFAAEKAREEIPLTAGKYSRATLKIQDGCSFFCSYCIVPHTRGRPRSRPFSDCLEEARRWIAAGYQELVVTGCNIACYQDAGKGLADLLEALADLPGMGRVRIGSLEPVLREEPVFRLLAEKSTLCRFLHLPIQSGDSGVLSRMKRHYTAEQLRKTLDLLLALVPDIGLGADLITGFPGESDEAFAQTRRLVEDYPFSNLHVFPYSERPGTPAATFSDTVPVEERKRRARELIALRVAKRESFAQQWVGKSVQVLVEKVDEKGDAAGWTGEYLPCRIVGVPREYRGKLISVTPHAVEGERLLCVMPDRMSAPTGC